MTPRVQWAGCNPGCACFRNHLQMLMRLCRAHPGEPLCRDESHAVTEMLRQAAAASSVPGSLFAAVSLEQRGACLSTSGEWVLHKPVRQEAHAICIDVSAGGLLDLFPSCQTTTELPSVTTCDECNAKVRRCAAVAKCRRYRLGCLCLTLAAVYWAFGRPLALQATTFRARVEVLGCPPLLLFTLQRRAHHRNPTKR